jgi:hypothetical protein
MALLVYLTLKGPENFSGLHTGGISSAAYAQVAPLSACCWLLMGFPLLVGWDMSCNVM